MSNCNKTDKIEWHSILGFPDYEVSNTGLVRSYKLRGGGKRDVPRVLKPGKHTGGYRIIQLRRNDETHVFRIGLLVLLTFRGPCPEGYEMCHNDGDAANDRLDNLRWDTHLANMQDAMRHGTMRRTDSKALVVSGDAPVILEKGPFATALEERQRDEGMSQGEFSKYLGIHQSSISRICNDQRGKGWRLLANIFAKYPDTISSFVSDYAQLPERT